MTETTQAILVGLDGSANSCEALAWAFDEARRSQSPLHLLHVASDVDYRDVVVRDLVVEEAERVVAEAGRRVPEELAKRCRAEWVIGSPAATLVQAASNSRMVVVGAREHGALSSALMGSVSGHVVRHATCSAVVARPAPPQAARVIAGVDATAPEPVLAMAFAQAASRDIPLTVIRAWTIPPLFVPHMSTPVTVFDEDMAQARDGEAVEQMVEDLSPRYPTVAVDVQLRRGDPRQVLVDASHDSELVVVGTHGRGRFAGLLLGSTSAAVSAHAHCPVLVAR